MSSTFLFRRFRYLHRPADARASEGDPPLRADDADSAGAALALPLAHLGPLIERTPRGSGGSDLNEGAPGAASRAAREVEGRAEHVSDADRRAVGLDPEQERRHVKEVDGTSRDRCQCHAEQLSTGPREAPTRGLWARPSRHAEGAPRASDRARAPATEACLTLAILGLKDRAARVMTLHSYCEARVLLPESSHIFRARVPL